MAQTPKFGDSTRDRSIRKSPVYSDTGNVPVSEIKGDPRKEMRFDLLEILPLPKDAKGVIENRHFLVQEAQILSHNYVVATVKGGISIYVWDIVAGCYLGEFQGHTMPILKIVVSDGGEVISFSEDQTIRMWEVVSMSCIAITEIADFGENENFPEIGEMEDITWVGRDVFAFHYVAREGELSTLTFMELSTPDVWSIKKQFPNIPSVRSLDLISKSYLAVAMRMQLTIVSIEEKDISFKETFNMGVFSESDVKSFFTLEGLSHEINIESGISRQNILCLHFIGSLVFLDIKTRKVLQTVLHDDDDSGSRSNVIQSIPLFGCTQVITHTGSKIYQWSLTSEGVIQSSLTLLEELVGHHGSDIQISRSNSDDMFLSFARDGLIIVWKNAVVDDMRKERRMEMILARESEEFSFIARTDAQGDSPDGTQTYHVGSIHPVEVAISDAEMSSFNLASEETPEEVYNPENL